MYSYVRSRQLEGTFPGSPKTGVWPITALRIARGWGQVSESRWPYNGKASAWPPPEPPDLDRLAKWRRIWLYERVRSINDCRIVMGIRRRPVLVSVAITDEWYRAPNGRISVPRRPVVGNHSVTLFDYDDDKQEFTFLNSWGKGWGDAGYGHIDYHTFQTTWIEGWTLNASNEKFPKEGQGKTRLRKWGVADCLFGIFHCVEIVGPNTERVAWLFAVERDEFLDVEELFVHPEHRNRGNARKLVQSFHSEVAEELGRETRYWVPHSNTGGETITAFKLLVSPFGLALKPSKMRWAAYEASRGSRATPAKAGMDIQVGRPKSPFCPIDEQ